MPYRPLPPASLPPRDQIAGVLLLVTEDQPAPERWLARAHLSEPTPGDPSRQDLYLVAPDEVQALDLPGLADVGGPVIPPAPRQHLVAMRERDAHPRAGDGVPPHIADPSVRPPPLQLVALVVGRDDDITGVCLEVRDSSTVVALECVGVDGIVGHWRRIDLGPFTALRAQARAPFVERPIH